MCLGLWCPCLCHVVPSVSFPFTFVGAVVDQSLARSSFGFQEAPGC